MRTRRVPSELVVAVLIAVVGAVDAAIGDAPDLVVLFVAVAVLCAVVLLRSITRRRAVAVRDDVARWLEITAAEQGETMDDLADRAISTYRAALAHDAHDTRGPSREAAR